MSLPVLMERDNILVPLIVEQCLAEVERRGMTEEGIYRLSGNAVGIQELKHIYDTTSEGVDLTKPQWYDINLITGTLKLFLRELHDSVIPAQSYTQFIDALGIFFSVLFAAFSSFLTRSTCPCSHRRLQ